MGPKTVLTSTAIYPWYHFWVGEFTTHFNFRTYFSGGWDVHRGYDLGFDHHSHISSCRREKKEEEKKRILAHIFSTISTQHFISMLEDYLKIYIIMSEETHFPRFPPPGALDGFSPGLKNLSPSSTHFTPDMQSRTPSGTS